MRIALAEDGVVFRDGLVMLLAAAGHDVVHCVSDGDQLVAVLDAAPVDVAVLDVRMPPGPEGGLLTGRRLRLRHPDMGLLLLSHHTEAHYLSRVLEFGGDRIGYRLKDRLASVATLDETLARIADGEIVIEPALVQRLVDNARRRKDELASLSEPECRTLRLMAEGLPDSSIAAELLVSRKSVERQVGTILAKLALPADAASYPRRVLAIVVYLRSPRARS